MLHRGGNDTGDANDDNSGGSVRSNVRSHAELIGRDDRFLADP